MQSTTTMRPRWRRPGWLRPGLLWFAFDLLVPTALFYLLVWQDASLYLALLASAAISAVTAPVRDQRGARGQRFAPYMLALALLHTGAAATIIPLMRRSIGP